MVLAPQDEAVAALHSRISTLDAGGQYAEAIPLPNAVCHRAAPGLAWAVVTALVGAFTKDCWWPAIRQMIGWG
jgi:hypothetical protein